jgi:pimeloyl-ACP methyl ester carboxylesterase
MCGSLWAMAVAATPLPRACPAELPTGTRCYGGRDAQGAFYRFALPPQWNGVLVVHAHGGPLLTAPNETQVQRDLRIWAVWLKQGAAYAGSSYAQAGHEVRAAARDTERVRQLFVATFGQPRTTVLHGHSWGANVALRAHDLFPAEGAKPPFDALLLTAGVVSGGLRAYEWRLDIRAVWQAVCGNHPRPSEAPYPLWQGLPRGQVMPRKDLQARVAQCIGTPGHRSAAQAEAAAALSSVLKMPADMLGRHLQWGTEHFADLAWRRLEGRNAFGNADVRYQGSPDDAGLNQRVPRFEADASAVAALREDSEPLGRLTVPVLTLHGIHDAVVPVELASHLRDRVAAQGRSHWLLQTYTTDAEHDHTGEAQYVAAYQHLLRWQQGAPRPTAAEVAASCQALAARVPGGCRFLPNHQPAALETRIPARRRP